MVRYDEKRYLKTSLCEATEQLGDRADRGMDQSFAVCDSGVWLVTFEKHFCFIFCN